MTRRLTCIAALLTALVLGAQGSLSAQAPAPAPAPNVTQPGAGAPNVTFGRQTFYWEIAMVVVLFGGALYAVCRSSERR